MWNLFERFLDAPELLRSGSKLARESGLVWSLTQPGLVALARVLMSGSQNPSQVYRVHGRNAPSKPALIFRGRTTTWGELDERIDRLAAGLRRRGIGRKQSLLLMMRNRPEHVELAAATARLGASAVSVSWRSTAKELAYLSNHSGARGIAIEPDLLPVLEEASGELDPALLANVLVVGGLNGAATALQVTPLDALLEETAGDVVEDGDAEDDASVVMYTSGTTGKPKGAVRKFPRDTMLAALRFINATPLRVEDVHLVACPLDHATAYGFLALSHLLGQTVVIMEEFETATFLDLVERHGVTTTALVPTMMRRLMTAPTSERQKRDLRSLRVVFAGGAQVPGPLALRFMDAFGDILHVFYGSTETGLVTLARPEDLRFAPTTIGPPVPGNDIRLLDDRKRDVEDGEVGELYVKSKLLVAGYHRDEEATRESLVDGYFSVGDLARRDRYGRYFIEGRTRDMVISGGVNVYPVEVEAALQEHPSVEEAAVVGAPDPEWGERVRAFVVRASGSALVDEAALKAFLKDRLAPPKVPREVVFVDALPRNATGKVLKRELRERA